MIYKEQQSDSGIHLASLLLGVAAGVAGTIIFATYNERSFNKIVGKTREMSDGAGNYIGQVGDNVRHKASDIMDTARHGIEHAGEKVRDVVGKAAHSVEHAAGKVAERVEGGSLEA